jgi:PHD/YefM family antitoxin component YafN of YafNO toxin-antitoxin module
MLQSVSSVEVSKAFGRISRQALVAPLTITHHGHDSLVLMSATEYQRLKSRDRQVYSLDDVPDEIANSVRTARAPAEAATFDHEVES